MYVYPFKYFLFFIFISIISFSCREEIIAPQSILFNVNAPVQVRSEDTYTFSINAIENSSNITDFLFSKIRIGIFMAVSDYSSGSVEISLIDTDAHVFYSRFVDDDVEGISSFTQGYLSKQIRIKFTNFTGRLIIQLSGT